jgi:hypothetical protein
VKGLRTANEFGTVFTLNVSGGTMGGLSFSGFGWTCLIYGGSRLSGGKEFLSAMHLYVLYCAFTKR